MPARTWDEGFRRKRATNTVLKIKFSLEVPEVALKNISCETYCKGNTSDECKKGCFQSYKQENMKEVNKAFTKFKRVLQKPDMARPGEGNQTTSTGFNLQVAGLTLTPKKEIKPPNTVISCSKGSIPKEKPGLPQYCCMYILFQFFSIDNMLQNSVFCKEVQPYNRQKILKYI